VTYNVGFADITMLFSPVSNCISTFASKISTLSIICLRYRILFLKFLSTFKNLKYVKNHECYLFILLIYNENRTKVHNDQFLKFIKFAFSICVTARYVIQTSQFIVSSRESKRSSAMTKSRSHTHTTRVGRQRRNLFSE